MTVRCEEIWALNAISQISVQPHTSMDEARITSHSTAIIPKSLDLKILRAARTVVNFEVFQGSLLGYLMVSFFPM